MAMPGRTWQGSSEQYRYGMNGVEKNNQLSTGYYDTYYRMYDSRIGRWMSPDVVVIPFESTYAGMANNPIVFSDPLGDRVKYNHFSDFLKVAKMWLSSSQFRKDWRNNVMNTYGMGGKSKEDLTVSVDNKSSLTLNEAVHSGAITTGKATKDHSSHLKYNGNIDAAVYEVRENEVGTAKAESGGSGRTSEEKFHFYGNTEGKSWDIKIKEKDFINSGLFPSHKFDEKTGVLFVKIQQNLNNTKMQNGMYRDEMDYAPSYDKIVLTYQVTAMGVRKVFRVEKTFWGGWDFANKTPSTLPFTRSKTFTSKLSSSTVDGSRKVYLTNGGRND